MLQDYEIKKRQNKTIIVLEFILLLILFQSAILLFSGASTEEAIQFRIIANSNTKADQLEKERVYEAVYPLLEQAIETTESNEELIDALGKLEPMITAQATSIVQDKAVKFGREYALIPPKRSGFTIQPQAHYDAYVLTIGQGRGDNWWCSLFPNVCFPEEEAEEEEQVTFFLWEWIKSLFS